MAEPTGRNIKTFEDWTRRVLEELAKLNSNQESLCKDVESLKEYTEKKLDDMSHIIVGNGDPSKGLLMRMTFIEGDQKKFDEFVKEDKDRRTWLFRTSIAACFTAIMSLVVAVGKYFITN